MNSRKVLLDQASRYVPQDYFDNLKPIRKAEMGDILFSVTGSIAIPAIVTNNEPFVFQRHIAILKPNKDMILSKFLFYLLDTQEIKNQADDVATGTAQLTIPLSGLRGFSIKLPSFGIQKRIVVALETALEKLGSLKYTYEQADKLYPKLIQSILAKAFRGELVTQDPNDEPASEFLKRIKTEREELETKLKRKKKVASGISKVKSKKMIIPVIDALRQSEKPLSAQQLLSSAGYPNNAGTDQVEQFFLDIRKALEDVQIETWREDDQDYFKLVG